MNGRLVIKIHTYRPYAHDGAAVRGSVATLATYHFLTREEAVAQFRAWLAANTHLPRDGSIRARFLVDEWIGEDD